MILWKIEKIYARNYIHASQILILVHLKLTQCPLGTHSCPIGTPHARLILITQPCSMPKFQLPTYHSLLAHAHATNRDVDRSNFVSNLAYLCHLPGRCWCGCSTQQRSDLQCHSTLAGVLKQDVLKPDVLKPDVLWVYMIRAFQRRCLNNSKYNVIWFPYVGVMWHW